MQEIVNALAATAGEAYSDVDKCARLALDSLSGVVFADDAQVAALSASKMFAASAGCRVTVASLEGTPPLAGNGAQQ